MSLSLVTLPGSVVSADSASHETSRIGDKPSATYTRPLWNDRPRGVQFVYPCSNDPSTTPVSGLISLIVVEPCDVCQIADPSGSIPYRLLVGLTGISSMISAPEAVLAESAMAASEASTPGTPHLQLCPRMGREYTPRGKGEALEERPALVLAEDLAHRSADLADRGVGGERFPDGVEQVALALGGFA